jgi:hypothetical protein
LPPSSSATSLRLDFAAACMIARPALVDPVKLTLLISGQLHPSENGNAVLTGSSYAKTKGSLCLPPPR